MSSSYFKTPNYREAEQNKLVALADKVIHGSKEVLVSRGWGPLVVLGELSRSSWTSERS